MDKKDFSSYKKLYMQSALGNMQTLKNNFPILEQNMRDQAAIEEIHRAVHNLKTESLLMEHGQLAILCRILEDMFSKIKSNQMQISESLLSLINDAMHRIEQSLANIRTEDKEIDMSILIHEIKNI